MHAGGIGTIFPVAVVFTRMRMRMRRKFALLNIKGLQKELNGQRYTASLKIKKPLILIVNTINQGLLFIFCL